MESRFQFSIENYLPYFLLFKSTTPQIIAHIRIIYNFVGFFLAYLELKTITLNILPFKTKSCSS